MKASIAAIVMTVLFATAAAQAGAGSKSSITDRIPVELHFDASDLSFDKYDGYDLISVSGCRFTREIGKPALPVKSVFVAMPTNSELTGIEVVSYRTKTLSGEYMILPAQPPIPTMAGAAAGFVPPGSIYDSSDMYPDAVCGVANVGSLRGYKILSFRVFPLQYRPAERRLLLHEEIILDVRYETPRYAAADAGYVGDVGMTKQEHDEFHRIAAGLVANPGDVSRAIPTTRTITEDRIMPLSKSVLPDGDVEYVIITSDSLEDEFWRLADWKTKKGVPATVVNTSWIEGSYAGTGVDTQERIRNFISDTYTAWGTKWVLLGGDTNIIPCRGGYGLVNGSAALAEDECEDKAIPADLYYSDLDGNWDANGNLTYGEVNYSVDLYPDVFVGRAPVDSVAEARTFVDKTLRYEKNPPPNYTRDILFLAEYLDAETDGGDTKDMIEADCMLENFSLVKLYERYGNLSKGSAMGELNRGCNIVNHIGHGGYTGFSVGPWWFDWIRNSDASSLTNSPRNFILYTISCNSNNFENDSVSERYMNNEDGGSVGYIGNSRHGWYDPEVPPGEGPSDLYDREFFNITFNESAYRLGEVVGYSKVRYIPLSQEDGNAMRWLQYAINILGDPELPIRTDTPRNFLISMPSQIPSRKQTLVISVSEIGHDHGSVQVRNATVCILKSGEVYNVSKTDASGLAEFTIDPDAGVLEVTVTKENYHVYEGVIDIYSPDIYVNTTGWWRDGGAFYANGTPIQSAVDGADVGETIFVRNGSYTENVDADKTLTLRGEGADVVTVTAADSGDHVFEVSADRVNISGFAVSGAVDGYRTAGVYLNDTDHCDISRNNASNNDYGICLYSSDNNTLTDNIASNNDHGIYLWYSSNNNNLTKNNASSNGNGIKLSDSRNNTLASNIASNNHFGIWLIGDSNNNTLASNTANFNSHHGIYLIFSSNNTLTNNTISKNKCNFGVYGSSLSEHIQSIDASNMVDEKPIYYWVNQEDETIPCDAGFVGVVNCTNITVRDQTLMKNRGGVLFAYTNDSRIVNVTSGSNEYHGICLLSSSNNTLANNTVSKNVCGIYMYRSSNNTLEKNTASNNHGSGWTIIHGYPDGNSITIPCGGDGIFLDFSSNNSITCNLLQNNTNRGVYLKGESTNNKISCNNIIENGNYNATTSGYEWQLFHFLQTDDIDASDNWWGTTNDDIINASIYGWNGNSDVSNATYLPKLGQPAPCAPTPDEPPAFTTTDAVIALQISVGSRPPDPRWDVRRDDSVTSLDALMILQAAAGAIEL